METNDSTDKDMMTKLKESFSFKSFSSRRYHSSLICNSKTIRMDVNLIDENVLTSARTFSGSDFTAKSSGNVLGENREASSWQGKSLKCPEVKNKSAKPQKIMKIFPKSEKAKKLVKIGDLKSSNKDRKLKLKTSVKHSYQAQSHGSVNQIETKPKKNHSEYESFRCDICMKYFSSKRGVTRHSVYHSSERHPCEMCGKVFRTSNSLKRHWQNVHEVKVKSLQCTKCYKVYSKKSNLKRHLKNRPDHVQPNSSPPNDEFVLD